MIINGKIRNKLGFFQIKKNEFAVFNYEGYYYKKHFINHKGFKIKITFYNLEKNELIYSPFYLKLGLKSCYYYDKRKILFFISCNKEVYANSGFEIFDLNEKKIVKEVDDTDDVKSICSLSNGFIVTENLYGKVKIYNENYEEIFSKKIENNKDHYFADIIKLSNNYFTTIDYIKKIIKI